MGLQYFNFKSFKKATSLPIGMVWGLETKLFAVVDSSNIRVYLCVPIGLRGLININDFVLSPDVYYHIHLATSKIEKNEGKKCSYMVVGANVRWKFVNGGAHLNIGKHISYFGLRAGISL